MLFDDLCMVREAGKPGDIILDSGVHFDDVTVVNVSDETIVVKCNEHSSRHWTIPINKIAAFSHVYRDSVKESEYMENNCSKIVYCESVVGQPQSALQRLQPQGDLM